MQTPHSSVLGAARRLFGVTLAGAAAYFTALAPGFAQEAEPRSRTESPYFHVSDGDPAVDRLPLKSTRVEVRISGVIADVVVTQHYRNEGQGTIHASYVFPGSSRAAVYGMQVHVGDRIVQAQIREREQARAGYAEARRAGKTAALLEQHRPNVFQMRVANILPRDDVKVELRYTELLVPQEGSYQFVFPTVVGPRYNAPAAGQPRNDWAAQPYLPEGTASASDFDLLVEIASPIGLKDVRSPSHPVEVSLRDALHATVELKRNGRPANNRDYILDFRLGGDRIEAGVLLHRGADENFFLAMVEPPRQLGKAQIVPREYIFVVDISGSMHGFPLGTARVLLRELIGGLRPSDTFNVLLFAGSSSFLAPQSVPATPANIEQAIRTINEMRAGGGTELVPALRRVYGEAKAADISRTVVLVTDGYVTVESDAFALVRKHLSEANLFAFGIGTAVNRHLIEGLARAGMSEPFVVTQPSQARAEAERFRRMIESPVLTSVRASFRGLDVYDVEPAQLPDVLGERPVIVFGKWRGTPQGEVAIEGMAAAGPYRSTLPVGSRVSEHTEALRSLWARHRVQTLSDQEALDGRPSLKEAITELGLRYNLLTQYTSFLAVDQVVRTTPGFEAPEVKQPLPLPQGVSNMAVGAAVPGTPEPETWGAVALLISMLAMLRRRAQRQRNHRFTS